MGTNLQSRCLENFKVLAFHGTISSLSHFTGESFKVSYLLREKSFKGSSFPWEPISDLLASFTGENFKVSSFPWEPISSLPPFMGENFKGQDKTQLKPTPGAHSKSAKTTRSCPCPMVPARPAPWWLTTCQPHQPTTTPGGYHCQLAPKLPTAIPAHEDKRKQQPMAVS
ncbi:hypothetical protein V6N13_082140 [Hibiscus sabdariffa]